MPTDQLRELLEETGGDVCAKRGHRMEYVLPLQTREDTQEILFTCGTCYFQEWKKLTQAVYEQTCRDFKAGRLS